MTQNFLFICGHRKSGTTMFGNLFDSHPEIATYPTDITLLYGYYPQYVRSKSHSDEEKLKRLDVVLFASLENTLKSHPHVSVDVTALRDAFFKGFPLEILDQPNKIITHFAETLKAHLLTDTNNAKYFLFKETSIEIYAQEISEWFPDAKFIQILRDPRDNYAALKAGVSNYYSELGEGERETLASLINRSSLGFKYARINQDILGQDRYKVVRFEDVVQKSEETMADIANFLGVTYNEILLTPTFLGQAVDGNSYEGVKMPTISGANIGRWPERISEEEAKIIEFHFAGIMEPYGYQCQFSSKEAAAMAAEFYKWQNYRYFFGDPFKRYESDIKVSKLAA